MAESTYPIFDPTAVHHPLSESEIDELANFLESEAAPEESMSIEQADGFLCALAAGPLPVAPARWLPILWGDPEGPAFESPEQAKHITALLMRHWHWVEESVRKAPAADAEFYLPLVYFPDEAVPDTAMDTDLGREWAAGFAIGINLDGELWDQCIADPELLPCFAPVLLLELGHNPDQPDLVVDFGKRKELVFLLPWVANEFYRYWRSHTPEPPIRSSTEFGVPYRAEIKPGRNDPCPCGSGRKYKKCCGATEHLH
jgi:uncharacterized protein